MTSKIDHATVGTDTTEDLAMLELPRGVRLLFVEMLVWSCAHGTDGLVPKALLHRITDESDPEACVASLVAIGRLVRDPKGWLIAGFGESQLSARYVERLRKQGRDRQRAYRDHRAGEHSWCDSRKCPDAPITRDVTSDVTSDVTRDGNATVTTTSPRAYRSVAKRSEAKVQHNTASPAPAQGAFARLAHTGKRCYFCGNGSVEGNPLADSYGILAHLACEDLPSVEGWASCKRCSVRRPQEELNDEDSWCIDEASCIANLSIQETREPDETWDRSDAIQEVLP